jgi:ATP synthase protein I
MSADDDAKTPIAPDANALKDEALNERLKRLSRSLNERQEKEVASTRLSKSDNSGFAKAFRLSADFLGGVIAGGLLGWIIDRFFGTSPFGLLVFVLLGFAAGTLNVIRTSQAGAATGSPDNHSNDADKAS